MKKFENIFYTNEDVQSKCLDLYLPDCISFPVFIYFHGGGRNYPPMQIIVSENDMENRFEQTQLLISTLKHFEVDMSKVDYRYMKEYSHCGYVREYDENGISTFAKIVFEFIENTLETEKQL